MRGFRARGGTAGRLGGLLLVLLPLGNCSALSSRAPSPPAPTAAPEVPVILVPGLTGSMLRDARTGGVLWGRGADLLRPGDGGYALAMPIGPDGAAPDGTSVEAFAVVEAIRVGPVRRGVYRPLIEALEARGYRRGRLTDPIDPDATLYPFAYDWRRSAVRAAGELAAALADLRRARGEEVLRVDLLCQSSGAYVCRWLTRYGGATLDEVEAGATGPPARIQVRRVVLVGAANGGSLRTLGQLDRGRRYLAPFGRTFHSEVLFTMPGLYEDLPHRTDGLFIDASGGMLPPDRPDLYDAASWQRFGWSVFADEAARRLADAGRRDLFGSPAERLAFLERSLDEARRFQLLLVSDRTALPAGVEYHLVGNGYAETPRKGVLLRNHAWRLLLTGDRELERRPHLKALATAPGDGHATLESMLHLSPAEHGALATEPFLVPGRHFAMVNRPEVHRHVGDVLLE